jgi:hypothetical protein
MCHALGSQVVCCGHILTILFTGHVSSNHCSMLCYHHALSIIAVHCLLLFICHCHFASSAAVVHCSPWSCIMHHVSWLYIAHCCYVLFAIVVHCMS